MAGFTSAGHDATILPARYSMSTRTNRIKQINLIRHYEIHQKQLYYEHG